MLQNESKRIITQRLMKRFVIYLLEQEKSSSTAKHYQRSLTALV